MNWFAAQFKVWKGVWNWLDRVLLDRVLDRVLAVLIEGSKTADVRDELRICSLKLLILRGQEYSLLAL
jgi:hypothetical protein